MTEVPVPASDDRAEQPAGEPEIYAPRIPYDYDWVDEQGGGEEEPWGCNFCPEGGGGEEVPPPDDGGEPRGCDATVCFDVDIEKDISFIAIDAEPCPGGDIEVSITKLDGGPPVAIDQPETTVGRGQDCGGELSPDDLKVEGIDTPHVEVCVTFTDSASPGSIEVWAKAGTQCFSGGSAPGTCSPCKVD